MGELETLGLILLAILIPFILIILVCSILQIIGLWKMFKKSGKKGWEAIIPYYNTWTLIEISGCKWWYFLILIGSSLLSFNFNYKISDTSQISFNMLDGLGTLINYFIMFCVNYNIAKKFNKDRLYAVGLTLLPFIFYPILGLGKSEFDKNVKVSPYGVIKEGEI